MIVVENCQLEYDEQRGVLYVHNKDTGTSVLRICRLPIPDGRLDMQTYGHLMDITCLSVRVAFPYDTKGRPVRAVDTPMNVEDRV